MTMDLEEFVKAWQGPEALDFYHIDWIVKHAEQLERDIKNNVSDVLRAFWEVQSDIYANGMDLADFTESELVEMVEHQLGWRKKNE